MTSISSAELQRLLDDRDIVAVATAYTWALDQHRWDGLRDVFTDDATATLGNPDRLVGIDAIIGRIRAALERLDDSQHLVGNHEVVVSGDTATHRCYLHAQHIRHGANGGPHYIVAGRYEDEMTRTGDGWRITHRNLQVMWTRGNTAVVRGDQ
ncbi:MAG: nuclear transport factor 2 family protein [Ilumatobacter sp.]|uniref:nuclear transport factor 2 family protein n=1 Tax=Ilumatobacter sp. TaxID=1967498 RepID=UPI003C75668F